MKNSSCILIVDDNLDVLDVLTKILNTRGYSTLTARDGEEALLTAQTEPIDLILLDVNMPLMDGFEVCRQLKADNQLRDIPIIFLTAVDSTEDKVKGFQVGGVDYIIKPFYYEEIFARIEVHLSLRNTQKQLESQNIQLELEIARRQETQKWLYRSESLLSQAQQLARLGNWEWDLKTGRVTWSNELYRIYGLDPELYQPVPYGFLQYVHDDDREMAKTISIKRLQSREIEDYTHRIIRSDGEIRFIYSRGQVIVDDANVPVRMFGTAQDVTQQKQTEEELRSSKERYQALFENTNDAVFIIGLDMRHKEINQRAADMLGYSSDEIIGRLASDFIVQKEYYDSANIVERLLAGETIPAYERIFQRKDGTTLSTEINITLIRDHNANPLHFHSVVRDISERKALENALRESEQRYRQIVETASDLVYTTDDSGYFTYLNPVSERITGYLADELIGKRFTEVIAESWRKRVYDFYKKQLKDREPETRYIFLIVTPNGEEKWVEQTTILLCDGDQIEGFQCICRDITQSKKLQDSLSMSEKQLSQAQHIAHIGSFEWDIKTGQLRVSDAMYQLVNLNPEKGDSFTLQDINQWIHAEDLDCVTKIQQQYLIRGAIPSLEYRVTPPDEAMKYMYSEAEVVTNENGEPVCVIGIIQDITERKQIEAALRDSENRYRQMIENAIDAVYTTDEKGNFTYLNDVGAQIVGYPMSDLIGKHFTVVISEAWRQQVQDFYSRQFQDRIRETRYEFPIVTRDGNDLWVEQMTTLLIEEDHIKGFQSITRDITERKIIETERERLIAELDAFAHTVAHDLKTPLSVLTLRSNMLDGMFDRMSEKQRHDSMQAIQHMTEKMSKIVDALLLLANVRKTGNIPSDTLDMAQIIAEAQNRLSNQIQEYNVDVIVSSFLPVALGYAPWVEEIWVNYLGNALKYGGKSKLVEIGGTLQADGMARFWVKDQGIGILPEDQTRLFTPFTRLNQIDAEGHGLGLSIVQRIVERLGGTIGVSSEVGRGTTFYFTLPIST